MKKLNEISERLRKYTDNHTDKPKVLYIDNEYYGEAMKECGNLIMPSSPTLKTFDIMEIFGMKIIKVIGLKSPDGKKQDFLFDSEVEEYGQE